MAQTGRPAVQSQYLHGDGWKLPLYVIPLYTHVVGSVVVRGTAGQNLTTVRKKKLLCRSAMFSLVNNKRSRISQKKWNCYQIAKPDNLSFRSVDIKVALFYNPRKLSKTALIYARTIFFFNSIFHNYS